MNPLESRLLASLARITSGKRKSYCTGFFVAPGVLVTAAHGLKDGRPRVITSGGEPIDIARMVRAPAADLALLFVNRATGPCAPIIDECATGDPLYTFGYTDHYPGGEPATLSAEGITQAMGLQQLKLKAGQVVPGFSGAPLLNLRTGGICGIIVRTRGRSSSLGARAVSVSELWTHFPEVRTSLRPDLAVHRDWTSLVCPLRDVDRTFRTDHYAVHDDGIDVEQLMIEPRYRRYCLNETKVTAVDSRSFVTDALDILDRQRILFIFGPYGSGKTLLSKIVQRRLFERNDETHFFQCADLTDSLRQIERYCRTRPAVVRRCVLLFDGFDETSLLAKNRADTQQRLLKQIIRFLHHDAIHVVVNSRLIPSETEELYYGVNILLHDELQARSVDLLTLEHYGDGEVERWLDSYANVRALEGVEHRLYRHDLKRLHKNLHKACKNPLFLYMISRAFADTRTERLDDIYDIYSRFVDSTVAGKFSITKTGYHPAIQEVREKYRNFLRTIALAIYASDGLTYDESDLDSWSLDSNTSVAGVPYESVRQTVDTTARELIESQLLVDLDHRRLRGNVLACYFLEEFEQSWRFRDNNIVYFLLAELMFEGLRNAVRVDQPALTLADSFPGLTGLSRIPVHPVSMNMLRHRLRRLNREERKGLIAMLLALHRSGALLSSTSGYGNDQLLRIKLLLVTTLLALYDGTYREAPGLFEEIDWLARALAVADKTGFDALRTSFRDAIYREAVWVGATLQDYNFTGSSFHDCVFKRCELRRPRLDRTHAEKLLFEACEIKDLDIEQITGILEFDHCPQIAARFRDTTDLALRFRDCRVRSLIVHGKSHKSHPKLSVHFERCTIEQLILRDLEVRDLRIVASQYPTLKVEGSNVHYDIDDLSQCSSRTPWRDTRATLTPTGAA